MRTVVLRQKGPEPHFSVDILPIPQLAKGEILVRVQYAAVTTHDLALIQGLRETLRPVPFTPGYAGSGLVVNCGDTLHRWRFMGKRVAFFALGAWAEYAVVPSDSCFILIDSVSAEQAVSLFLTPLTICMFEELIDAAKATAVVQTSGVPDISSAFLRVCNYRNIQCVSVVKDAQSADRLFSLGARYLIQDADPKFAEKIAVLAQELNATMAFDASGGDVAGAVLSGLCPGGVLYSHEVTYDSQSITSLPPSSLIFQHKRLLGLDPFSWWDSKSALQKLTLISHIQKSYFMYRTESFHNFSISMIKTALEWTKNHPGDGVTVIEMNHFPDKLEEEEEEKTGESEVELALLEKEKASNP